MPERCDFCGEILGGDVFERYGLPFCSEKHSGKSDPESHDNPDDQGSWRPALETESADV